MDETIAIHVDSLDAAGARFVAAWHAAETGRPVLQEHIAFIGFEGFARVITPRRLDLLRLLRASGAMSVRALGVAAKRDYKSVHGDVALLENSGLIRREARDRVSVPWSKLSAELDLAA